MKDWKSLIGINELGMRVFASILLCALCCIQSVAQNEVKEQRDDNSTVYLQPDKLPVFPSGMEGLMAFLRDNVRYPDLAHKQGVQGRVIVQFVVNSDGSISDAKVIKSVHEYLDKEALRVVNAMPYWEPGVKDGQKVREPPFDRPCRAGRFVVYR